MTPKKLPSSGLKRGASLPPAFQKGRDHTEAIRVLVDVFGDPRKMMLKDVNVPEKPSGQDADSKTPRNPKVFPVGRMLGNVGIQETGSTPDGPMDLDLLDLEAQAMAAAGCPINLLPPRIHHSSMDGVILSRLAEKSDQPPTTSFGAQSPPRSNTMQENTQKAIEAYRQALEKYEAAAGRVARLQETRLSAAAEVRKAEQAVEAATAIVQGSVSEADGDPVQALRDLDTARGNLRTAIEQNAYAKAAPSPSPSAGRETDQLRQYRQFACRAIADEELLAMPPEALVILNRAFSVLGGPASVEVWEQLLADTFRFDATTFKDRLAIREEVVAHYGLAGGL